MSPDDRYLAYLTDTTGFRQFKLQIKDLKTGELFSDSAERATSMAMGVGQQNDVLHPRGSNKQSARIDFSVWNWRRR